jgi:hypothetical protein
MLESNLPRVIERMHNASKSLDVGGWHKPLNAATHVIDIGSYETRCRDAAVDKCNGERFSASTWQRLDICDRTRWPFPDKYFDFACCSHVLEDIRDPVWVCSELSRVSKAGYIETPTPASELLAGHWPTRMPTVGQLHHRWFVEFPNGSHIIFRLKPHNLLATGTCLDFWSPLYEQDFDAMAHGIFWDRHVTAEEAIFGLQDAIKRYLPDSRALIRFAPVQRLLAALKPRRHCRPGYTPAQAAQFPYT